MCYFRLFYSILRPTLFDHQEGRLCMGDSYEIKTFSPIYGAG